MRLIDANELRDRLQNLSYDDWNQGVSTSWAEAYSKIADMINDMHTIDAVEVVRCEDCKYYDGKYPYPIYYRFEDNVEPDDYCSYGEKTEVDG